MSKIRKYIGFLILILPVSTIAILSTILNIVICITGLPFMVGIWLLKEFDWLDYIKFIFFPLNMIKDLFNEIL